MSLSTVFSSSVSLSSNATFVNPFYANHAISVGKMSLTGKQVTFQTNRFLDALKTLSGKNESAQDLKPLSEIFQIMMHEENETVKSALTKNQGFVSRLFSHESWDEWTQNKTALGRVANLFSDFLSSSIDHSLIKKSLSDNTIQTANREAIKVLEQLRPTQGVITLATESAPTVTSRSSCTEALFLGAAISALSHNPLPLGLASLQCAMPVAADFQDHIVVAAGKSMYFEATRKIALCKKGNVAWNDDDKCDYHGPAMHVTVMLEPRNGNGPPHIHYSGIFKGSNQWFTLPGYSKITLFVENESDQESAMYVHAENG